MIEDFTMAALEEERWRDYDLVQLHTVYAALVNPHMHFDLTDLPIELVNLDKSEVFKLIVERIEG